MDQKVDKRHQRVKLKYICDTFELHNEGKWLVSSQDRLQNPLTIIVLSWIP